MMKGYSRWNWMQLVAMLVLLFSLLMASAARAETSLSVEDYQEIVSTCSIDPGIPDYSDYLHMVRQERPNACVIVDAADCVRYEGSTGMQMLSDI